jgi:hypothetical protein
MRSHRFRNEIVLATGLLVILLSSAPAGACRWRCDDRLGNTRGKGIYGYQAYIPTRPRVRMPSRAALANTPPVPGGSTTLDPPGLMTTQGILESPIPGPGPTLLGSIREGEATSPQGMTRIGNNGRSSGTRYPIVPVVPGELPRAPSIPGDISAGR